MMRRLEQMNTEIIELKTQSQISFRVWDEARISLADVIDLKQIVNDSTRRMYIF